MCEFCFAFKHKNCGFAPFSELPTTCADTDGDGGGAAFDCDNDGGGLSRPIAGDPDCVGACDADECCGMCFLSLFVVVISYVVRACVPELIISVHQHHDHPVFVLFAVRAFVCLLLLLRIDCMEPQTIHDVYNVF